MERRLTIVCILGIILGLLMTTVAWSVDDQEQKATAKDKKTEVSKQQTKPSDKGSSTDQYKDPWEGKERVKGWSTSTVVVPPPYTYYNDYPNGYYSYRRYRQPNPWGYQGPPVVSEGDRYDSALVWDRNRQGLSWQPIVPQRSTSRIPGPVVNPNFVRPSASDNARVLQPIDSEQSRKGNPLGSWEKRGLVSNVDREAKQLTIITPKGVFIVDARDAVIVKSGYRASIANISEGDSVKVWADFIGLNTVAADRIEVNAMTNGEEAGAALQPVRMTGKIVNIDYPSFTFSVRMNSGDIRVLASDDTVISSPDSEREAFMNLKLGQTVKIVAIGSLTSGFAASEVVIVND